MPPGLLMSQRVPSSRCASGLMDLVDTHYPHAKKITLVMDNLNTHRLSCLYEAFTPEEARRIVEKIEVVHTPKHGSWLDMAECELSVLEKQCLGERIADQTTLGERVATSAPASRMRWPMARRVGVWSSTRRTRNRLIIAGTTAAD
jgi:hypothetical protein